MRRSFFYSNSDGEIGMPAIEVGRICQKTFGRETGKKCVIVDVMDKSFVLVTGPKSLTGVKRRRVNINHIEPLQDKVDIKKGASDDEVAKVLQSAGKTDEKRKTSKTA
jgi:large subunit ribosomal protein L14e